MTPSSEPTRLPAMREREPMQAVHFRVERFDYGSADMLLRLGLRLSFELEPSMRPMLLVEHHEIHGAYSPLLCSAPGWLVRDAARLNRAGDWLWRAVFAVERDVVSYAGASFSLRLRDTLVLELPAPRQEAVDGGGGGLTRGAADTGAKAE